MPRYFSEDHEWIDVDGDTGTVGITDYAQSQLGDITYVDLPEPGSSFAKGDSACVVDSVKAASDVYSPVSGTISIARSGAATINGAGTTLTRTRATNPVGFVVLAHSDADAYGVSGI